MLCDWQELIRATACGKKISVLHVFGVQRLATPTRGEEIKNSLFTGCYSSCFFPDHGPVEVLDEGQVDPKDPLC